MQTDKMPDPHLLSRIYYVLKPWQERLDAWMRVREVKSDEALVGKIAGELRQLNIGCIGDDGNQQDVVMMLDAIAKDVSAWNPNLISINYEAFVKIQQDYMQNRVQKYCIDMEPEIKDSEATPEKIAYKQQCQPVFEQMMLEDSYSIALSICIEAALQRERDKSKKVTEMGLYFRLRSRDYSHSYSGTEYKISGSAGMLPEEAHYLSVRMNKFLAKQPYRLCADSKPALWAEAFVELTRCKARFRRGTTTLNFKEGMILIPDFTDMRINGCFVDKWANMHGLVKIGRQTFKEIKALEMAIKLIREEDGTINDDVIAKKINEMRDQPEWSNLKDYSANDVRQMRHSIVNATPVDLASAHDITFFEALDRLRVLVDDDGLEAIFFDKEWESKMGVLVSTMDKTLQMIVDGAWMEAGEANIDERKRPSVKDIELGRKYARAFILCADKSKKMSNDEYQKILGLNNPQTLINHKNKGRDLITRIFMELCLGDAPTPENAESIIHDQEEMLTAAISNLAVAASIESRFSESGNP